MIEHPQLNARTFENIEAIDRLSRLQQAQEVIGTIQRAHLAFGHDRDRCSISRTYRTDEKPFLSNFRQVRCD